MARGHGKLTILPTAALSLKLNFYMPVEGTVDNSKKPRWLGRQSKDIFWIMQFKVQKHNTKKHTCKLLVKIERIHYAVRKKGFTIGNNIILHPPQNWDKKNHCLTCHIFIMCYFIGLVQLAKHKIIWSKQQKYENIQLTCSVKI